MATDVPAAVDKVEQVTQTETPAIQSTAIQPYWPSNLGFAETPRAATLAPGTMIDRFGSEFGRYTSPAGTPFEMRALPPQSLSADYSVYEVLKPLPVQIGRIAPAFGQLGGGLQHMLPESVVTLVKDGFLRKVTEAQ